MNTRFKSKKLFITTLASILLLAGVWSGVQEVRSSPTTSDISTKKSKLTTINYQAQNGKVLANGQEIQLRGINWFGFETSDHVVHGLWERNWLDMIDQMQSLNFNAIRLPYCPDSLKGVPVSSVDYTLNPDLTDLSSEAIFSKVVTELNRRQIYFILDHHSTNCGNYSPLWYTDDYSETEWINNLTSVAATYANLPYFVGIDPKNELYGTATWGTGNEATDWNLAAERAGRAINQTNPNLLIFIQGIADSKYCSKQTGNWWGGNLQPYACNPINNAYIPADKLVLSPHIYGSDLAAQSYFSASTFPDNLPAIWSAHFGFLREKGLTIIPGEWGGKYGQGKSTDKVIQDTLVEYFQTQGICNSFYWAWNPNSHDVGGLLNDDWQTPIEAKVTLLSNYYQNCR